MDWRLPRSPVLKSPLLSPKSPSIYEKYKSGCAWGLIHFFDFRQAHSHGMLISDKKRANRQAKCKEALLSFVENEVYFHFHADHIYMCSLK